MDPLPEDSGAAGDSAAIVTAFVDVASWLQLVVVAVAVPSASRVPHIVAEREHPPLLATALLIPD